MPATASACFCALKAFSSCLVKLRFLSLSLSARASASSCAFWAASCKRSAFFCCNISFAFFKVSIASLSSFKLWRSTRDTSRNTRRTTKAQPRQDLWLLGVFHSHFFNVHKKLVHFEDQDVLKPSVKTTIIGRGKSLAQMAIITNHVARSDKQYHVCWLDVGISWIHHHGNSSMLAVARLNSFKSETSLPQAAATVRKALWNSRREESFSGNFSQCCCVMTTRFFANANCHRPRNSGDWICSDSILVRRPLTSSTPLASPWGVNMVHTGSSISAPVSWKAFSVNVLIVNNSSFCFSALCVSANVATGRTLIGNRWSNFNSCNCSLIFLASISWNCLMLHMDTQNRMMWGVCSETSCFSFNTLNVLKNTRTMQNNNPEGKRYDNFPEKKKKTNSKHSTKF